MVGWSRRDRVAFAMAALSPTLAPLLERERDFSSKPRFPSVASHRTLHVTSGHIKSKTPQYSDPSVEAVVLIIQRTQRSAKCSAVAFYSTRNIGHCRCTAPAALSSTQTITNDCLGSQQVEWVKATVIFEHIRFSSYQRQQCVEQVLALSRSTFVLFLSCY